MISDTMMHLEAWMAFEDRFGDVWISGSDGTSTGGTRRLCTFHGRDMLLAAHLAAQAPLLCDVVETVLACPKDDVIEWLLKVILESHLQHKDVPSIPPITKANARSAEAVMHVLARHDIDILEFTKAVLT